MLEGLLFVCRAFLPDLRDLRFVSIRIIRVNWFICGHQARVYIHLCASVCSGYYRVVLINSCKRTALFSTFSNESFKCCWRTFFSFVSFEAICDEEKEKE